MEVRWSLPAAEDLERMPYIVVYRVTQHAVEISRIFHGAHDWP